MSDNGADPILHAASGRKRKSKGKGLRTRTGCASCRARRVKCDETHPSCRACAKAERQCIYPESRAAERVVTNSRDAVSANTALVQRHDNDASAEFQDLATSNDDIENASGFPGTQADGSVLQHSSQLQSNFQAQLMSDGDFGVSPGSNWSEWASLSAEAASLRWFGLLANDAVNESLATSNPLLSPGLTRPALEASEPQAQLSVPIAYVSQDVVTLSDHEIPLLQHYVTNLSGWIDVTDRDRSFAIIVPQMALKNRGLMNAILALSARHLSLRTVEMATPSHQSDRTLAVQYYHEVLKYLQREMENAAFLRSDELLATVLIISTYEMIDGSARGWERHLKGVFGIQRSQLIHGESEGLKKRIWWAWLRQDIWVAFRERRKILSYYRLARPCTSLDFWELVDRSVWLLGQCINFGSSKEIDAGNSDVQARVNSSTALWDSLHEWYACFETYDRRLPSTQNKSNLFKPIWINPVQSSLAIQAYNFCKLLLLEHTPAMGGLKELSRRQSAVDSCVETICGIASCTDDDGASIVSTLCIVGAGPFVKEAAKRRQVIDLLQIHRNRTGWPPYDLTDEMHRRWIAEDE